MKTNFKKWVLEYDPVANQQLYAGVEKSASEECNCSDCKNFLKMRDKIYPKEILDLYFMMGIDPNKEIYLTHTARKEPGLHYYTGAHISNGSFSTCNNDLLSKIRKFIGLPQKIKYKEITTTFLMLISSPVVLPLASTIKVQRDKIFQIEFFVLVPWVLESEAEPTYG